MAGRMLEGAGKGYKYMTFVAMAGIIRFWVLVKFFAGDSVFNGLPM